MAEPTPETRPIDEQPVDEPLPVDTNEATPEVAEEVEDEEEEQEEDIKSKRVTLADLSAKGTALYAHKKYEEATDIFSRASDLQAEINGETAPENAEILFHYGRSLFKVGQTKSDVLGGSAVEKAKPTTDTGAPKKPTAKPAETEADKATEGQSESSKENKADESKDIPEQKKPYFQFTGDENFDESEEDEQEEEEQEEDDDDLATAFEILDLARVCYLKQLDKIRDEEEKEEKGKGKEAAKEDSSAVRHIKERLAETHDALAEISLENERYPNAIEDGRVSLNYKMELYPEESEIIAEAHYKLSLALEFASVTISGEDGKNAKREELDQGLRDEAIKEMELAIKSFRLKMQATEVEIASSASPEDNELSHKALVEMKEVIADMEERLVDLRKDPTLAQNASSGEELNAMGGICKELFGDALNQTVATLEARQARAEEANKTAVDLTGLVRRKKANDTNANDNAKETRSAASSSKRKAEDGLDGGESPKRARTEDEATDEAEK